MNQLNSVLLEGTLTADPVVIDASISVLGNCHFPIETKYVDNKNYEKKMVKSQFTIEAWNNVASLCKERLKKGAKIRAIGQVRARQDSDNEDLPAFFIEAEHIEIKQIVRNSKS